MSAGFGLACLAAAGLWFGHGHLTYFIPTVKAASPEQTPDVRPAEPAWAAVAPGRVQPKGGEVRIAAVTPALIRDIPVTENDRVKAGDLLISFDDDELKAKLASVKAELTLKQKERDVVEAAGLNLERRRAEDALYSAERQVFQTRANLDMVVSQLKRGSAALQDVERSREELASAKSVVDRERANVRRIESNAKLPTISKEDAQLIAARADVAVLEASIEKTKLRAPADASILNIIAKVGETAGSSSDNTLMVLGNTSQLQVRAEVEERDIQKVSMGQTVVIRSEAFSGRSFEGRVAVVARALTAPQLTSRNQRKQTDVDILDVIVDLSDGTPLIPGMRVDVYFKAPETAPKSSAVRE